jgi:hypothetical protein
MSDDASHICAQLAPVLSDSDRAADGGRVSSAVRRVHGVSSHRVSFRCEHWSGARDTSERLQISRSESCIIFISISIKYT